MEQEISDNNISQEEIYSSIIPELSSFLKENNNFGLSDEEIKTEIMYIIFELNSKEYLSNRKTYINKIKKDLIHRFQQIDDAPHVSDSIYSYLKEIGNYKLLSKEEELELFYKYKNGDLASKQELINRNLRLVVSIAKQYATISGSLLDAIQEGNIGLIKAIEKFNPDLGNRLSTYATWWIRQSILKSAANNEKTIKLPVRILSDISKIKKFENTYLTEHGEKPTDEIIAEALQMPREYVARTKEANYEILSLNDRINEEEEKEIGDFIQSEDDVEEEIIQTTLSEELNRFFTEAKLTEDQKSVLIHRFGLSNGNRLTLEQTSKLLKKSRDRIRQIEIRALIKLKRCSYKNNIINYYDGKYDSEKVKEKNYIKKRL